MAGTERWRKVLSEPNAAGWLAFLILVVGIGVGALIFDRGPAHEPVQASFTPPD